MEFWLQDNDDLETRIIKDELDIPVNKIKHSYKIDTEENFITMLKDDINKYNIIPIGHLDFVQNFLSEVYNINSMNPIEVPLILRQEKFLKRKYSIVDRKNLPKIGYYFIKYISRLKVFSYKGFIENLHNVDYFKDGLYQISEVVDILAEYRVFVHNDKIIGINYFSGSFTVMPNIDEIINMINEYKKEPDRPKAYIIDIAIVKNKGTLILEIHPFVSIGLYGYMFREPLLYCYKDGFEYYTKINKEIEL